METCPTFRLSDKIQGSNYGLVFEGYLNVTDEDLYTLYLESDDGSRLILDDELLINNDGLHALAEKQGEVALKAGHHRIRLEFFQGTGGEGLNVSYSQAGGQKSQLPMNFFFKTK